MVLIKHILRLFFLLINTRGTRYLHVEKFGLLHPRFGLLIVSAEEVESRSDPLEVESTWEVHVC